MAMMRMIVFNVDQGQCVFIRTPEDYGILINDGKSNAAAATWLADNEAPTLKRVGDHPLAALIVTHPHDESHAADIETVTERLAPAMIDGDMRDLPDIGARTRVFALNEPEAQALGGDPRQIVNNQSKVTVITYRSDEGYTWKVIVAGDNETKGLEALLARPEFRDEIAEADFFVTPYHGLESGFCAGIFEVMGKPIANISSTGAEDSHVDRRYGKLGQGVKFPDGLRKDFVTREDGNITVDMHDDGRYDVWLYTPANAD